MTLKNLGLGKKNLEARIQEEAESLVEYFATKKGEILDPAPAIVYSVTNVISAVIFGHRFSRDDKELHRLIESMSVVIDKLASMCARVQKRRRVITHSTAKQKKHLFDVFPWLMRHLPGPHNDLFESNAYVLKFVKKEIKSHKENGFSQEPQDMIGFYLNKLSQDPPSTFDEANMISLASDFLGAGMETTTTTLCWALLYLVNQPEIQEKVQKELSATFGESQVIQYEDRKRVPYTNAVIHEVLRISSIAPIGITRQTVNDTSLQGFNIEKGTLIIANLSSSLYDPAYWETPRQFNPGHFLDEEGNFIQKEAFLPFSAGMHFQGLGRILRQDFSLQPPETCFPASSESHADLQDGGPLAWLKWCIRRQAATGDRLCYYTSVYRRLGDEPPSLIPNGCTAHGCQTGLGGAALDVALPRFRQCAAWTPAMGP
ncbi:hypothetical protein NDU88_000564 [Pleurodeles waltl]|uniref:Uncharacterized protein n=1 Tax=Pleurodeles waltl TaxID=8319 RepID=A0AAV7L788_PLEWA|nr:hypothetical protein NDU88_000564 [Pleurodeles waltl]